MTTGRNRLLSHARRTGCQNRERGAFKASGRVHQLRCIGAGHGIAQGQTFSFQLFTILVPLHAAVRAITLNHQAPLARKHLRRGRDNGCSAGSISLTTGGTVNRLKIGFSQGTIKDRHLVNVSRVVRRGKNAGGILVSAHTHHTVQVSRSARDRIQHAVKRAAAVASVEAHTLRIADHRHQVPLKRLHEQPRDIGITGGVIIPVVSQLEGISPFEVQPRNCPVTIAAVKYQPRIVGMRRGSLHPGQNRRLFRQKIHRRQDAVAAGILDSHIARLKARQVRPLYATGVLIIELRPGKIQKPEIRVRL